MPYKSDDMMTPVTLHPCRTCGSENVLQISQAWPPTVVEIKAKLVFFRDNCIMSYGPEGRVLWEWCPRMFK